MPGVSKPCGFGKLQELLHAVLVGVFRMNPLTLGKSDRVITNHHLLITGAAQEHLDTTLFLVVTRLVLKVM